MTLASEKLGTETLRLVAATPEHKSFIISTWVRSYARHARALGFMDFYREPESAEALWNKAVVLTDDDGYVVYAWAVGDKLGLDYVYVVPELRGNSVGKHMAKLVHAGNVRNRVLEDGPHWLMAMRFNPYGFFKEKA